MGIREADRTLPSNRLVFDVRREPAMYTDFPARLEALMRQYGLSEEEKSAWRSVDIRRLGELGVHPYFLPQISRLFKGASYNHNRSDAAQLYAQKMGIRE